MVLEHVYSDDKRRVAQSTSKQIWDILYKDTVASDIMQIKGGEDDLPEGGHLGNEDDRLDTTESSDSARSKRKNSVHETPPAGLLFFHYYTFNISSTVSAIITTPMPYQFHINNSFTTDDTPQSNQFNSLISSNVSLLQYIIHMFLLPFHFFSTASTI